MKQLNWYQIFGQTHTIPDGRTVEPTDDIQIWLNCANIWDKTYTTLAEVLADTTTLLALINSNNAVDYMVRSTTWAVATALVPVMTDDTHPLGVASAGSSYSGVYPYYAFDGNVNTYWQGNTNFPYDYVQYDFGSQTPIKRVDFTAQGNSAVSYNYISVLQGSNDGVTFTSLANEQSGSITEATYTKSISVDANYRYYRLNNYRQSQVNVSGRIKELQFYSPSITSDSTAMSYIGLNNYCANTLLADSTWCNAICNSEYFESVLNVKVPTMTSNTTPSGECIGKSYYGSGYEYYKAFDGNTSGAIGSLWEGAISGGNYIGYLFGRDVSIKLVKYISRNASEEVSNRNPKDFTLQNTADGITWNNVGSAKQGAKQANNSFVITDTNSGVGYRMNITTNYGGTWLDIIELQFYGREDV